MGGLCSKKTRSSSVESAGWDVNRQFDQNQNLNSPLMTNHVSVTPPPPVNIHLQKKQKVEKEPPPSSPPEQQEEQQQFAENDNQNPLFYESDDDFYDGIPRYPTSFSHKSGSVRSKQAAVAKVVSSSISDSLTTRSLRYYSVNMCCYINKLIGCCTLLAYRGSNGNLLISIVS